MENENDVPEVSSNSTDIVTRFCYFFCCYCFRNKNPVELFIVVPENKLKYYQKNYKLWALKYYVTMQV